MTITFRVGQGFDVHALVPGRRLVIGGVEIPFERGLLGHSDADVLTHAVIDALLGAIGGGDIGRHFPNTDPRWKNASGLDLLARTVEMTRARGHVVSNVDATIVLERPKLAPHVGRITSALAGVLGIDTDRVSVKAKTNEGVDAVGRGDAIAAHAVAMLVPLGVALGIPMPTGLRMLSVRAPQMVAWAWGMNGALSVLGATLADPPSSLRM